MPKTPSLTASEAERLLLDAGFQFLRARGSHRIYGKGPKRCIVPFHAGKTLHPKLLKQIFQRIEED